LKRGLPVVGFDIEGVTKKNYQDLCERKPLLVAALGAVVRHNIEHERPVLMQLGTFTGGTLLVRICRFANLPEELRNFLADRKIIKVPAFSQWKTRLFYSENHPFWHMIKYQI
jgi:hypothetical protein